MSIDISYNIACSFCHTTDDIRACIIANSDVSKYLKLSEYEFSKNLNDWFREMNVKCRFCNSSLVNGANIAIGDYKLYNFQRLVNQSDEFGGEIFLWKVTKNSQNTQLETGGKYFRNPLFTRECFIKLLEIIDSYPREMLTQNPNYGSLFISFTGNYNSGNKSFNTQIQKFYCVGMTYKEVILNINNQLKVFDLFDLIR